MGGLPFAQAREAARLALLQAVAAPQGPMAAEPPGESGAFPHLGLLVHRRNVPPPHGASGGAVAPSAGCRPRAWHHPCADGAPWPLLLAQQSTWGLLPASGGCADCSLNQPGLLPTSAGEFPPSPGVGGVELTPRGLTSYSMGVEGRPSQRVWLLDLLLMGQSRSRGCLGPWWCLPPPPRARGRPERPMGAFLGAPGSLQEGLCPLFEKGACPDRTSGWGVEGVRPFCPPSGARPSLPLLCLGIQRKVSPAPAVPPAPPCSGSASPAGRGIGMAAWQPPRLPTGGALPGPTLPRHPGPWFPTLCLLACREFAYVAEDQLAQMLKCHVFRCEAPAKHIASRLHEICSKVRTCPLPLPWGSPAACLAGPCPSLPSPGVSQAAPGIREGLPLGPDTVLRPTHPPVLMPRGRIVAASLMAIGAICSSPPDCDRATGCAKLTQRDLPGSVQDGGNPLPR